VIDPGEAAADPYIGQMFEFAFQDAASGEFVSSEALRGRVLVIVFWATWCPPCMESIPRMKAVYAKYRPQGVVFVGVSHDDTQKDGLQKLLNCVAEHQMPWPPFFQYNRELS
jgi:thiol-disulfide isomerase/thioredoxin